MARPDELLSTIEAIYAAGLDAELWPQALAAVTRLIGGVGATLENVDRTSFAHRLFYCFGIAPASELKYLDQYAVLNPRFPPALRQRPGELSLDYSVLDERAMDRSPFYMEFLAPQDLRYAIGGILAVPKSQFGVLAVQRSPRHGHAGQGESAAMHCLVPHVNRALDMARRLKGAGEARSSLERALDWLTDGVALVEADGRVLYANEALQAVARRNDGIGMRGGALELAAAEARARFEQALGDARRLRARDPLQGGADFHAARDGSAPPYLVSVRPLLDKEISGNGATAIVFVRDPLRHGAGTAAAMRQIFGLTRAEADLAQALQAGTPLTDYARRRGVSLNTVYTHLRRIKDKTGCRRMAALIRTLNELKLPLRNDVE